HRLFRLNYADGTQFVIDHETTQIWGYCPPTLSIEDLATYLVGPVLGFVLRRRNVLALHASCFSRNGSAFVLCGGAGSGKSTTVAALALRAISVLCEDIAALRDNQERFFVAPGYPRVNLWPAAAKLLGAQGILSQITPNWEKQFLPLRSSSGAF